ncbi:hypothetical protein NUU61_002663 [Penicillium alfredii]|uniref:Uncharacterized protein n=1 Tax=Penicillium alfredii TaxID=1506179 RepID=A0A9W9KGT9_9EURO|nr:uncharacterized protein NUU61_002663 [Penicillium alfredii]KAJ5105316.1 hypothetical protein NUU61_002663 [Penicillium alfredii]
MHFSTPLALLLSQVALGSAAGCGDADACVGTEFCTTAVFTTPTSTTLTTCVPTATCLGVYEFVYLQMFFLLHLLLTTPENCESGGSGQSCCSGYCAATKCRSTDSDWPGCREDKGPCLVDENCCYGNKCVDGLCTRP